MSALANVPLWAAIVMIAVGALLGLWVIACLHIRAAHYGRHDGGYRIDEINELLATGTPHRHSKTRPSQVRTGSVGRPARELIRDDGPGGASLHKGRTA